MVVEHFNVSPENNFIVVVNSYYGYRTFGYRHDPHVGIYNKAIVGVWHIKRKQKFI